MKKASFLFSVLLIVQMFFASAQPLRAEASYNPNIELTSRIVYLYNDESKLAIYEKDAEQKIAPGSLAQIMTAIVAIEQVEDLDNTKATAKAWIYDELYRKNYPTADVRRGETLSIRELLYCMLLQSAYEAASVIADYVSDGSFAYFAEMMNKKAQEIGCENTYFTNPHGAEDEKQYTTAKDMQKIAQYAMGLPAFAEIVSKSRYTVAANNVHSESRLIVTTNRMIDPSSDAKYYYEFASGLKTGGSTGTGRAAITVAKKNGLTYYCVTMGSPTENGQGEYIAENGAIIDAKKLFQWAYSSFSVKNLLQVDSPCAQVKVRMSSDQDFVLLYPQKEYTTLVADEVDQTSVLLNPIVPESVDAPIEQGRQIGHVELILAGEVIANIPLVAKDEVSRNPFLFIMEMARAVISSIWFKIGAVVFGVLLLSYVVYTVIHNRRKKNKSYFQSKRNLK